MNPRVQAILNFWFEETSPEKRFKKDESFDLLIRNEFLSDYEKINNIDKANLEKIVKNLIEFPLTKSLTIPHHVIGNFGACKIIMRPSVEGSGVIAGGAVRIVLEVAGVKNVIAKQLGSNNILNNARAAVSALDNLTTRTEVAKKRDLQ